MARDGNGNYDLPGADLTNGTLADADEVMSKLNDIATALTGSLAKNGETVPTASLPMGGFNHTGVGVATARTHYARASQVADGSLTYGGVAGGTADALTIAPSPAISAYVIGQQFQLKVGAAANTTAVTLNVNSVGTGAVTWPDGTALVAGDLPANAMVLVEVQATTPVFHLQTQTRGSTALNISGMTAETAPATDDVAPIYDTSATANRKMTLANLLKVINAFTEDTGPDVTADFGLTYDASAAAVKKVLLRNFGQVIDLTAIDVTGASAADIVLDTTNHRALLIFFDAIVLTSDGAQLLARVSTDGGSTFLTTATYNHARGVADSTPTFGGTGNVNDTAIVVAANVDSTTSQNLSGFGLLLIGGAAAHATKLFDLVGHVASSGVAAAVFGYGSNSTASQVNGLRFVPSTSTFASGFIRPYAILK